MLKSSLRGWRLLPVVLAGVLVGLPGCGTDATKLVAVEGTVLVGGEPLKLGTSQRKGFVQLNPDASRGNTSLERPAGEIDSEGHYRIMTNVKQGVTLGWYKVAVNATFKPNPDNAYKFDKLVPDRYFNDTTSVLELQVVENPAPDAYNLKLDAK